MAVSIETGARFERADGKLHREQQLPATAARQGRSGRRVLAVLVAALILSFIVWIPVEIWGNSKAGEADPQSAGQNQMAVAPAKAAPQPAPGADAQQR